MMMVMGVVAMPMAVHLLVQSCSSCRCQNWVALAHACDAQGGLPAVICCAAVALAGLTHGHGAGAGCGGLTGECRVGQGGGWGSSKLVAVWKMLGALRCIRLCRLLCISDLHRHLERGLTALVRKFKEVCPCCL